MIKPYEDFRFNGGEVHLRVTDYPEQVVVTDYTMDGFMALCQYAEVARRGGVYDLDVIYPYFPYARQDRIMEENEPFSLKVFTDMLNAQMFRSVTIWDPHSDVAPALIDRCHVISQDKIIGRCVPDEILEASAPVSPDAGAFKKVAKLVIDPSTISIGTKTRSATGEIAHAGVQLGDIGEDQKHFLIVDDICDGGRTFIALAQSLKDKGAESVYLYVTHGIFSHGTEKLKRYLDGIYTTNSFTGHDEDGFVIRAEII